VINPDGASYPYQIPGVIDIFQHNFKGSSIPDGRYYTFYDIEVEY